MRSSAWLALLPGALTVYLGYSGGGYFPTATGVACALVALALVLRLTLAERPLEGLGLAGAGAAAALALLAVWALVSSSWSDAPGRAVLEFDRTLLYLLALLATATLPRTSATARWLALGLLAGAAAVCLGGLATRILPDVFPTAGDVLDQRLSYPVSYWNGLGLLAAVAIVLATHAACAAREHVAVRVAGAALLPALAATLYFTFSRASIALVFVGVAAYLLLARPRGLLPALLAAGPATALAVKWCYDADLLASRDPRGPGAVDQGQEVTLVLALCVLAAAAIRFALARAGADARLERIAIARRTRLVGVGAAVALTLAATGAAWVAFDLGERVERQYERFEQGDSLGRSDDARERLTQVGNNGRLDHWDKALEAWREDELKGTGAGTYEHSWARLRPTEFTVRDGHSLYLEMLSELGLVGLALLAAALLGLMVALARRACGPERALWAALLAAMLVWALHAGQDWDWEMPSVTLWLFAAGGLALARPPGPGLALPRLGRVIAALFVLALSVTPVLAAISHERLSDSVRAFRAGDCGAAIDSALDSSLALAARAEPYALLAYCDVRLGKLELAERMMRGAIERDPDSWEYHYGLALVLASGGRDPRAEIAAARRLNPLEALVYDAQEAFEQRDPARWRRYALRAPLPIR